MTTTVLDRARAIVRSRVLSPEDIPIYVEAARLIPRDQPLSSEDATILRAISNMGLHDAVDPPPSKPTPFDAQLAEADGRLAEAQAAHEKAQDALYEAARAVDQLTGAGHVLLLHGKITIWTGLGARNVPLPKRAHIETADQAAEAAAETMVQAREAHERALAARNAVAFAQSRWRAVAALGA